MRQTLVTANQYPNGKNYFKRAVRTAFSLFPHLRIISYPTRPQGISIIMRVKDEEDWIGLSIQSIRDIADEIVIVDNGSIDRTYEMLEEIAKKENNLIKLWRKPELDHCALSNFALDQTTFRWIFRWDGDMVARTTGNYNISNFRERILSLGNRRYYLIYLRHINLAGDLFHQDPKEMVHIEEYIHTFSDRARYIHPGRFEAVKFPKYYRPLFWYEPYSFHVNVKPARRMLLRHFWEDWMELKDYRKYPQLEDYVKEKMEEEFETKSWEEAQEICVQKVCKDYIPYNPDVFGPYPDLLKPHLESPKYSLKYKDGKIVGRAEI